MSNDRTDEPRVRLLTTEDELVESSRLVGGTMLGSVSDEVARQWTELSEGHIAHGAVASTGEVVGIARWFATDLSLAGPSIPAAGITAVAVLATHRRQGHLRRLMATQLESLVAAEVPIALLVAAEWPIYGRFGYGPAIEACAYEIDATSARFTTSRTGSIELVAPAELQPHLEVVHDLRWARTIGAVTRRGKVWEGLAGVTLWPGESGDLGKARGALWRDDSGDVQGAVAYGVEDAWKRNRPTGKIEVKLLVGATPEAERELWRHLCETDWISTVTAGTRSVDDPVAFLFDDGRAVAQVDRFDCIWARILDVPRVFGARRSALPGRVVIEVVDDLGYANGRWALELGPDGADVTTTSDTADVHLPVAALGAVSLGGTSVARLHEAGWLDEESPNGVARLDALLHTPTAPWSPTTY
jgi:predicted acetyltransferase